jgi:hypothetical protein
LSDNLGVTGGNLSWMPRLGVCSLVKAKRARPAVVLCRKESLFGIVEAMTQKAKRICRSGFGRELGP